jgi:hypothetical protein
MSLAKGVKQFLRATSMPDRPDRYYGPSRALNQTALTRTTPLRPPARPTDLSATPA